MKSITNMGRLRSDAPLKSCLFCLLFLVAAFGCSEAETASGNSQKRNGDREENSIHLGSEPNESIQRIVWAMSDLSSEQLYREMLSLFTTRLSNSFSPSFFENKLNEKEFRILNTHLLSFSTYVDRGYAVVRQEYQIKNRKVTEHNVLFYRKEGDLWKLDNFPFRAIDLPNWGGRVPDFD